MGLFSRSKPKINVESTKKDGYSGWVKCPECSEMIHASQLEENLQCCPKCDYHYRLSAMQRVEMLTDKGTFEEKFTEFKAVDPLTFVDEQPYTKRLEKAQKTSGRDEAIAVGTCKMGGRSVCLAVCDFGFMAGSMGSVVGERLTSIIELAIRRRMPVIIVSASGGARMQESVLSLMQMAKTSAALAKLHEAGLPFVSVLTNPTLGGVTASFASLGDVIIAEPDALIGFAGPRVVEQVTGQKLPPKAQKSEFLLEKGMIDCILNRHQLKDKLQFFLSFLMDNEREFLDESDLEPLAKLPQKVKELLAFSEEEFTNVP
ncbi:MAG: acetyl-CoA carboxylase carboxyltransferase subunit beta [Verrucomicrobia bacterium]|nr:acetyl-CoA carboxylase carboxyltransferase subunit beta [Verrucomicrobiota bacterium]